MNEAAGPAGGFVTICVLGEETTMAAQRSSFEKLQRERNKKTKAAAKRERRFDKDPGPAAGETAEQSAPDRGHELPAERLLELVEQLHNQYENKQIGYDEFEEKKADLLSRLPID